MENCNICLVLKKYNNTVECCDYLEDGETFWKNYDMGGTKILEIIQQANQFSIA